MRSGSARTTCGRIRADRVSPKQLPAALAWSRSQSHARGACLALIVLGRERRAFQPAGGATLPLGEAKGLINHRDLAGGEVGSRMNYLSALVAFHQGNIGAGDAALADALAYEKTGSKRLLQIGLADYYLERKGPSAQSRRCRCWRRCSAIRRAAIGPPTR